ncbi:MAG TPA: response regulator [Verrucomicrobiae bacterium]|jgi:two-component system KDP operon response regulator KdpE|nr:response regulator [Verrucomicrobiae bacterium]
MEKALVLVVDDEPQIRRLLRASLEMSGYGVVEAATGQEGIAQAIRCQPDIMLLDLGLPDMDGNTVLKRFREWSQAPVMVVSARRQEADKITALDNGANDYITKPFGTGELLARLRVMRRNAPTQPRPEVFQSGNLTVDTTVRAVRIDGETVRLSATEYALLLEFVRNAGKVLTHGHLLLEVWGIDDPEKISLLRVYMGYLREKLETVPTKPRLILTEPGVGYRLVVTK